MKSRIRQLKKLFHREDDSGLVPTRYADYCEGDDMPVGLFEKKRHRFRFYFTRYPHLQSPSQCVLDLEGDVRSRLSSRSFQIGYNSIQERLFRRFYDAVSSLDNVWFQQNDEFLHHLSIPDKFALVAMTNKSQQHIQAYLKGEDTQRFRDRVRAWKPAVHGYLPLFFPIYNRYKKVLPKGKTMREIYQHVVEVVCPALSDQEIVECLVELVQQVRHLFTICPKTTQTMTVWRGLRSTPAASYPGFTSVSLNPLHTLHYTGDGCCLQKLTILPGTPLLFLGGLSSFRKELECVLPDNRPFYEVRKSVESIPIVRKMKENCPPSKDMRRVIVHHAVVL